MFKVLFLFFFIQLFSIIVPTQNTGFLGSCLSWDLTIVLSTNQAQKASPRSWHLFLVFLMQGFVFSYVYISWEREGVLFLFVCALWLFRSLLTLCCPAGNRRTYETLGFSFSFRKLSVWVINQFLLRSWSCNVLWFHAFHRDDIIWFLLFFAAFSF